MKKIDLNRNVFEGWTPKCFIDNLEPTFDMIMAGKSHIKPFTNNEQIRNFCVNQQPYYKKHIPEVNNYFKNKFNEYKKVY